VYEDNSLPRDSNLGEGGRPRRSRGPGGQQQDLVEGAETPAVRATWRRFDSDLVETMRPAELKR
jgi:hypothetical protein